MLFMLSALILSVAAALSVYFFLGVSSVAEWLALIPAYLAIIYAIVTERNPIEARKQQIYDQLKGTINNIITILKEKDYTRCDFTFWDDIRNDSRYEMLDEKFAKRLDDFHQSTYKYSYSVSQLDYARIPKIIKETVVEVFQVEPNEENVNPVSLDVIDKSRKPPKIRSVTMMVDYLKQQVKFSDVINRTLGINIDKTKMPEIETEVRIQKLDPNEKPFTSSDSKKIAKFWNTCLQKVNNLSELQFVVKENNNLLREAREIKEELIKHIKKSIER